MKWTTCSVNCQWISGTLAVHLRLGPEGLQLKTSADLEPCISCPHHSSEAALPKVTSKAHMAEYNFPATPTLQGRLLSGLSKWNLQNQKLDSFLTPPPQTPNQLPNSVHLTISGSPESILCPILPLTSSSYLYLPKTSKIVF